jgi:hypothetical protein
MRRELEVSQRGIELDQHDVALRAEADALRRHLAHTVRPPPPIPPPQTKLSAGSLAAMSVGCLSSRARRSISRSVWPAQHVCNARKARLSRP